MTFPFPYMPKKSAFRTPPHTWWRVRGSTPTGWHVVVEMELYEVRGGPNVATDPARAVCSSNYPGNGPERSLDADFGTAWVSGAPIESWIGYSFSGVATKGIVGFKFSISSATQAMTVMNLEWTEDFSTWTTLFTTPSKTWTDFETATFYHPDA
jgi:hypothetical protein